MAALIDDLLKLSRVTRSELKLEAVDLSALATEVLTGLQRGDPGRALGDGHRLAITPVASVAEAIGDAAVALRSDVTKRADIDAALDPDCVGSVERLPFADGAFDVVTCFQVLEHLPYERFAGCVGELARVARRAVVISLPDTTRCWRVGVTLPRLGSRGVLINVPWSRPPVHEYDGSHHWEVGAAGYPAARIRADLVACGLAVTREFRAFDNPYHRFLVCRHPR